VPELTDALENLANGLSPRRLAAEVERLQAAYRDPSTDLSVAPPLSAGQAIAYAVYRMPATYAATVAALDALASAMPDFQPVSMLDLGAGAGAATWAAGEVFSSLKESTAVERDSAMTSVARKLSGSMEKRSFVTADLGGMIEFPTVDLAVASYSLNELSTVDTLLTRLVAAASTVVVVEPGTPRGFAGLRLVRKRLIELGLTIAAPCPHSAACPIVDPDWCHFSVRLQRSAAHRRAKRADLDYEDEKFSYVVASRLPVEPVPSRVLRHPQVRSGHTLLRLCTGDGLQDVTISKRQGETYKRARRVSWGDPW
jgi:ribosomal protein RSM22 (predicted rRNA methylase)